jgi:hypothetical protein
VLTQKGASKNEFDLDTLILRMRANLPFVVMMSHGAECPVEAP